MVKWHTAAEAPCLDESFFFCGLLGHLAGKCSEFLGRPLFLGLHLYLAGSAAKITNVPGLPRNVNQNVEKFFRMS